MEDAYGSLEVVELAGCSYRQLDYWCRIGALGGGATGSGSRRQFTTTDVMVVRGLARLSAAGLTNGSSQSTFSTIGCFAEAIRYAVEAGRENATVNVSEYVSVIVGFRSAYGSEP